MSDYDLIVIGGGINGAGIARDAALRGLSVLLLEQNDFGSGTSSWSSRLIHGGLRYLEYAEFPLVFESLRERRVLQRIAPHLVQRIRLTIPVYKHGTRPLWLIRLGMMAYDLLSIGKTAPRHRMLSRRTIMAELPGLNSDGLVGGAQYIDAQVTFAERLVVENVIAASESGAVVKNYSPVIGLTVANNTLQNVQFIDGETGNETQVTATVVVNAAGPWVDRVLATVNRALPTFMGGTKGSHIAVAAFNGAPADAIYAETVSDGRPFFIIPWNGQYLIGTTDLRYDGDPGEATASDGEVDYLLHETNRLFPGAELQREDIHFSYAGIRPLPRFESGPESAITRKHIIKKHRVLARGLVSIIGGKLTTYRNLAEQTVNYVNRKAGAKGEPCRTRRLPLPGAAGIEDAGNALGDTKLSTRGKERLLSVYGGRARVIADLAKNDPELAELLDSDGTIVAAEVAFAVDCEYAKTLCDIVHRRMMIGLSENQGRHLIEPIAVAAQRRLGWSSKELAQQVAALKTYNSRLTKNILRD